MYTSAPRASEREWVSMRYAREAHLVTKKSTTKPRSRTGSIVNLIYKDFGKPRLCLFVLGLSGWKREAAAKGGGKK